MPLSRRRRTTPPGDDQPRPPAGSLEPLDAPPRANPPRPQPPPASPPSPVSREPEVRTIFGRFTTASAALVFAGQLPGGQPIGALRCLRGGPGQAWWISTDLSLETGRELVSLCSGEVYVQVGDRLLRDRGWGDPAGRPQSLRELRAIPVIELVRTAGLHPAPSEPLAEAVLLLPGHLVADVVRRALDLHLGVTYRPVTLTPLFDGGQSTGSTGGAATYELRLRGGQANPLPASLVVALDRDPFVLLCRRAGDRLLVQHRMASPLPDRSLTALVTDDTWVLAAPEYGCARLRPLADPLDGASLVRQGPDRPLVDLDGENAGWAEPGDTPAEPAAPELTLVRARMRGVPVDAALLDDADLGCLPSLLTGDPLAEAALLIRGRDRHLITVPGGLLEQLPVGEPLYCLGPGNLFVPLGYRLRPLLPPDARAALLPTDSSSAVVLLPTATHVFDLTTRVPVWTLWAGPIPPVDEQLPLDAAHELESLDQDLTRPAEPVPRQSRGQRPAAPRTRSSSTSSPRRLFGRRTPRDRPRTWRDDAYAAELAGDYVTAAELHARHNEPLRAARLYERAAQRS